MNLTKEKKEDAFNELNKLEEDLEKLFIKITNFAEKHKLSW